MNHSCFSGFRLPLWIGKFILHFLMTSLGRLNSTLKNSLLQSHMTMITGSSSCPIHLGFLQFSLSILAWSGILTWNHGSEGSDAVSTSDVFNLITRAGVDEHYSQRSVGQFQQELICICSAYFLSSLLLDWSVTNFLCR